MSLSFEIIAWKSSANAFMIISDLFNEYEVVFSFINLLGSIYERLKHSSVFCEKRAFKSLMTLSNNGINMANL